MIDTILCVTNSATKHKEDAQNVALHALLCCHHPAVVSVKLDLWESILRRLELDPKSFILTITQNIQEKILDGYVCISMYENTVATLIRISPEIILPLVIQRVTQVLNEPAMSYVTDDEYFTYLTPAGELYDKSMIPTDDSLSLSQVKRENKAYSYKEQLEELTLRREIEEKKRKEGKIKAPQLTPKQKEAIKNQTEKETAIRERLSGLNSNLLKVISQIEGAIKGNAKQLSLYFSSLLPAILKVSFSSL